MIALARLKLEISCYIPYPSVYSELMSFLRRSGCKEDTFIKLDTWLVKKTPSRYEVKIPAAIFYEYIISVRQKINRGRRLAEDYILEVSAIGKSSEKLEEDTANLISKFRDKFRTVMRQGLLDSASDLDVCCLRRSLKRVLSAVISE